MRPNARTTCNLLGTTSLLVLLSAGLPAAAFADEAPVENGASQISITLTGDDGGRCLIDHDTAKAGPVTFKITNETATSISEVELLSDNRILGEKENLAPGLPTVRFTATLGGGDYHIFCPGADEEMVAFHVTGEASKATGDVAALLEEGTKGYAAYVDGMVDAMVKAADKFQQLIDQGDLEAAKAQYPVVRTFYERIESDVEGFVLDDFDVTDNAGNLDYLVDMRASNLDPAVGWHGFHAIERDLFENAQITDGTKALAAELKNNVDRLSQLVPTLDYLPEDLANGAAGLLEEVQTNKITGEEEAYSHTDLVDFAANIEGAEQAFAFLEPGMRQIDPELTQTVQQQFAAVKADLVAYQDADEPGGYKRYTPELKASDAVKLSRSIQALQEPLSRIAEKVATAR